MKKVLVIFGAAFIIAALVSPSFAQFKTWGHLEVETYWTYGATYFDDDKSDNRRAIAERFRFYLQYGDAKTVRAVIGFETDSTAYGELAAVSSAEGPGLAAKNRAGNLGADSTSIELKHAYMDFVIPNTPISLMVGIQNFATGGNLGRYWLNVDAPGIRASAKFAPHTIDAAWYKEYKQNLYTDNDSDMYMLKYLLSQKQYSVEAWLAYENDLRSQTKSIAFATQTVSSTVTQYNLQVTTTPRSYTVKPWWVGLNVPFKVGNFSVAPIFVYEFGKARSYSAAGTDVDISAWMGSVEAAYQLGPGLRITAQGYYATGNDADKSDEQNLYGIPNASEAMNSFGNGWSVFYFRNTQLTYYGYKADTNIGGYWFGRLSVTYSPLSWLEIQPTYVYIGDTSEGSGSASRVNTMGRTDKDEDTVGQELNLIATLKIYNNLRYKIGFGYFFPGDVFKGNYSRSSGGSPGDDAWALLTNLNYAF